MTVLLSGINNGKLVFVDSYQHDQSSALIVLCNAANVPDFVQAVRYAPLMGSKFTLRIYPNSNPHKVWINLILHWIYRNLIFIKTFSSSNCWSHQILKLNSSNIRRIYRNCWINRILYWIYGNLQVDQNDEFTEHLNSSKPVCHVHSSPTNPCQQSGFPHGWNFARGQCSGCCLKFYTGNFCKILCENARKDWLQPQMAFPVQYPHLQGQLCLLNTPQQQQQQEQQLQFRWDQQPQLLSHWKNTEGFLVSGLQ